MSFVERNKIWLLPLLGVGVLGVLWMNFQTFKPKATPAATPSPSPSPASPAPPPPPSTVPPPSPAPVNVGTDLWADLRVLGSPPPELIRTEELLREGERPLEVSRIGDPAAPNLEPRDWQSLPEPEFPQARAVPAVAMTVAAPLKLDFVLEAANGAQEAWIGGRPYREGQSPDGVHRIKQIRRWSIVLAGPSGETRLSTELGRSQKANPSSVPAEAM